MEKGELMWGCKADVEMNFATAFWEDISREKLVVGERLLQRMRYEMIKAFLRVFIYGDKYKRGPPWLPVAIIFTPL